jgi:hypothetical protein
VTKPPSTVLINKNADKNLTLKCIVDSNPPAKIEWIKNDEHLVQLGEELDLTQNYLSNENITLNPSGKFTCRAQNTGFNQTHLDTYVVFESSPTVLGNTTFYIRDEHEIRIEFLVLSNPFHEVSFNFKLLI